MDWKSFGLNFAQAFLMNLLMGKFSTLVKAYPAQRLNEFLVRFGRAFGPPGLRHFSELSADEQAALLKRVPVLKGLHTDWLKPFQWVPRTVTVWLGPAPTTDDVLMGVWNGKPIPAPGQWFVLKGYLASTTAEGVQDRLGWRFDDVDQYFELSIALKV